MPRKVANSVTPKSKVETKPKKVVRRNKKTHTLPPPICKGEVLTDILKRKWKIGASIGIGGFGEIYSAFSVNENGRHEENYVIKIEPHSNGPLFSEMHFYQRAAKADDINEWISKHKLSFLGMPKFIASGSHEYKGEKYRFMVMERFGSDIQKKLIQNNRKMPLKTIYTITLKVIDVLEYIHSKDYVHADVKASNLLLGYGKGKENDIYLVDFGLACKYLIKGEHKEYKADPKRAHDGTVEYASRDAHIGVFSRRSDLETLAFNMIQWSCGKLPWEEDLQDCNLVMQMKNNYMNDIPLMMKDCYKGKKAPEGIQMFVSYVVKLPFKVRPDYDMLRNLIKKSLVKEGHKFDGVLEFSEQKPLGKRAKTRADGANKNSPKRRKPFAPKNNSPEMSDEMAESSSSVVERSPTKESIPTHAMLLVMQSKKKRNERLMDKKKKRKASPVASSGQTNGDVKASLKLKSKGIGSKSRTSPRFFTNSLSPEV